jgi:hypothetical protein
MLILHRFTRKHFSTGVHSRAYVRQSFPSSDIAESFSTACYVISLSLKLLPVPRGTSKVVHCRISKRAKKGQLLLQMQQLFQKISDLTSKGWRPFETHCSASHKCAGNSDSTFVLQRVSQKLVRFGLKCDTVIPCRICTKDPVDKTEQFEIKIIIKMDAPSASFSPLRSRQIQI